MNDPALTEHAAVATVENLLAMPATFHTFDSGFLPLGGDLPAPPGVDPSQIPTSLAELGNLVSNTYDLTVTRAGELDIPIVGSVSGGMNRRAVVLEWTRYKSLQGAGGIEYHFGYVIRFCLTVSSWDAKAKISLPFLTAQAELGNIQASWMMQVRGLSGPKIDAAVLPPQDLKVETFVIAQQSLKAIIGAVADPSTTFVSGIVVSRVDPTRPEATVGISAVRAFAAYGIQRGRSKFATIDRLGVVETAAADAITEVYECFGIDDPTAVPGDHVRERARNVLRGIKADL